MKLLESIIHSLKSFSSIYILTCIIILHTVLHIKYLDLLPIGFHQWRQTQTLSVARNFFEESMNIFQPRVDNRGDGSGITGMEFPLVNYLIAIAYRIIGLNNTVGRLVILFFSFIALIGCFLFTKALFKSQLLASISTIFLLFSPLFTYYSIVVMPDIPSLSFIFLSLYFLIQFKDSKKFFFLILSTITLTFAALIKISALVIVPYLFYTIWNSTEQSSKKLKYILTMLSSLIPVLTWYLYARYLSNTFGNTDFLLQPKFPYPFSVIPQILRKVIVQWLPELYINYAEFIFFSIGIYFLMKNYDNYKSVKKFISIYLGAFILYFIAFLPMFEYHDYYAIPILPVLIIICTIGFEKVLEISYSKKLVYWFVLILLIIMPILGSVRALSRFERASKPYDLFTIEKHLDKVIPDKRDLIIAIGDDSPSIYLYFMHRKGWAIGNKITMEQLDILKSKGAKYIVSSTNISETPEILENIQLISNYGQFKIYVIKK